MNQVKLVVLQVNPPPPPPPQLKLEKPILRDDNPGLHFTSHDALVHVHSLGTTLVHKDLRAAGGVSVGAAAFMSELGHGVSTVNLLYCSTVCAECATHFVNYLQ